MLERPSFSPQITIPQWLQLPMPIRVRLRSIFNLPRSTGTTVEDNVVMCDGHTHADLALITVEAMQKYTGSDKTDFWELYNLVVSKVFDEYQAELEAEEAAREEARKDNLSDKAQAIADLSRQASVLSKELTDVSQKKKLGRPRLH